MAVEKPFCHLGLFDESDTKAKTSAEGLAISLSADIRTWGTVTWPWNHFNDG